jgi:flavorubredoxin
MSGRPLPREVAPGVHWLGGCLELEYQGEELHTYNSVYLVVGDRCSALVEAGAPQDVDVIEAQVESLLATGLPDLRYLFVTHTETPHSAGLGRLLARYPRTMACGDMSDLHLVFPEFADRLWQLDPGDEVDLGGTRLLVSEAVFRDFPGTRWAFDTRRRVLFAGDGFSYSHYHQAGHCGCLAEEAGDIEIPDLTALFAEAAFSWTRHVDIEPYVERLERLVFDELEAVFLAPTHGLPIGDPRSTLPRVVEGLRIGSATASRGELS